MPQQWCQRCWQAHNLRTAAEWEIDGDLYCSACKQNLGYEAHEGRRLGRADAIASATPVVTSVTSGGAAAVPRLIQQIADLNDVIDPNPKPGVPPAAPARSKKALTSKYEEIVEKCLALSTGGVEEFTVDPTIDHPKFYNRVQALLRSDSRTKHIRWRVSKLPAGLYVTKLGPVSPLKNAIKQALLPKPKAKEEPAMNEKRCCPGYAPDGEAPICGVAIGNTKELCDRCYARRWYHQKKKTAPKVKKTSTAITRKPKIVTPATPVPVQDEVVSISVPLSAVDSWWTRLSTADKGEAFSMWIARAAQLSALGAKQLS